MKSVVFILHADYSVTIRRYLLAANQLKGKGVTSYFVDFTNGLKDKLYDYAEKINCEDTYKYRALRDFNLTQSDVDKYVGQLKIDTDYTDRAQNKDIKKILAELNFSLDNLLKLHKDEFLFPFITKYAVGKKIIEELEPSLIIFDLELDAYTRGLLFAAKDTGIKTVSMQHGEGNAEQYKEFPLLADYYVAYCPYNVKVLREMGVAIGNILLTGAPETDIFSRLDKDEIEREIAGEGYKTGLKNILLSLKPSCIENFCNVNRKIISDALSVISNKPDTQLIIKLHPNDNKYDVNYIHKLATSNSNAVVIPGSYMISKLFTVSDYIITPFSTAIVEASLLGKEVIVIKEDALGKWPDWNFYNVYEEYETPELKAVLKRKLESPINTDISKENRKNFAYYFRYKIDNNNTRRLTDIFAELISDAYQNGNSVYALQQKEVEKAVESFYNKPHLRNGKAKVNIEMNSVLDSIKRKSNGDNNMKNTARPTCLFINTYYNQFIEQFYKTNPALINASYDEQLDALRGSFFGDSFFYSKWLTEAGVDADDVIINSVPLQEAWKRENGINSEVNGLALCIEQIRAAKPDVVYVQDLNIASQEFIEYVRPYTKLIIGQIATLLPDNVYLEGFDIIISSFPHYVPMFRSKGITSYYQPLAFEPSVLGHIKQEKEIDVSFVGGLSALHDERRELLEYLAERVPLNIYGAGIESLSKDSNIRKLYQGEAWGADMFGTLAKSRITVNHHHKAAESYANNMRLFEATGCGALLITDYRDNLNDLFEIGKEVVAYRSKEECVAMVQYYMHNPEEAEAIAKAGQRRTLRDHTYEIRMHHTAEIIKRHLRYKDEVLEEPDLEHISYGHSQIDANEVTANLTTSWKSETIPLKQRALVNQELEQMYKGNPPLVYQVLAESIRPYVNTHTSVLEIGCASGYYYEILEYLLNKRIKFTGIDYSDALIKMAKDYYPGIDFRSADGSDLPFTDNAFDISVSSGILLHVPNYKEHVKETVRVASGYVVAHRMPVCRKRKTQLYKKFAYGEETVELRFNENEIVKLFLAEGLKLESYYEYYSAQDRDEYEVTYTFKKL